MLEYTKPEVIASYSANDLKDLIMAEACSVYSVTCGCYGGPQKVTR